MMTSRKDRETIRSLAALVYKQEPGILSGKTKLSLTTNSLTVLNTGFIKLNDVECVENSQVVIAASPMLMELQYLRQSMRKLPCIKIIHGTSTIQGRVDLTSLSNLRHLEVKKAPIHLLEGLHVARGNLLSITCSRCLQTMQDLFISCGGDMSSAHVWPSLKAACLSSNSIEQLDESLRYLPVLEYLDLSYNHLVTTQHYLELLTELDYINLGYNELARVPSFCPIVSVKLRTLVLRNNNLDNIDGVELLTGLRELDLCDNCLAEHGKLHGLAVLHHIKSLNLTGNPLYYHVNHRPLTLQYLSPLAVRERGKIKRIWLDNKLISDGDRNYVPRDPPYFEAPSGGGLSEARPSTSAPQQDRSFDSMHQKVKVQIHHHDSLRPRDQLDNVSRDSLTGDSDPGTRSGRRARKKARKVLITDLESSNDFENSTSREPSRGATPSKLSSSLNDRAEYETARKQLGHDWLVTVNEKYYQQQQQQAANQEGDSLSAAANQPGAITELANQNSGTASANHGGPFGFVGSPMDGKATAVTVTNEDLVHESRSDASDLTVKRSVSDEVKVEWNWSHESNQDEVDGEPYIVTRGDGCQMMAVLGDDFLWETNLNNEVCERFDLRSLREADHHPDGENCLCLTFDTLRSDRKERIYIMEDQHHAQQFLETLSPHLVQADRGADGSAMHCMKCDSKFTDTSKSGLVSCPSCGGNIVIQLDETESRQNDVTIGSFRSTDGMMPPLAFSSANTSPAKTSDGDNTSFRSFGDVVGSVQSAASFKSIDETDQSVSSFQTNSLPRGQSQNSLLSSRDQSESTYYQTADDLTNGSDQSYGSLQDSQTASVNESSSVINGFKIQNQSDVDTKPRIIAQISNPTLKSSSSVANEPEAVSSCPGLNKPNQRPAVQDRRLLDRTRLDSEESDITIISNPSLSSITVLQNPSREVQIKLAIPRDEISQKLARSLSLDEGKTLSEVMGTKTDDVIITDRENPALISPCGSLTTKTVSSMIDSMYERNLSPNGTGDTVEACERYETNETLVTERIESRGTMVTSQTDYAYNYEDYSLVDHRLKLWTAMSVLKEMEDLQLLLRCDVCRFGKEDLYPCLFLVTNTRIHFYRITAIERGQPADWLAVLASYPKSSVRYVDIGYGYQWFQIEVVDALFSLVMRDEARCKTFLTAFTAVLEDNCLSTRSELRGITKNQTSTMESLEKICEEEGDDSVLKRLFTGHAVRGKGDCIPVSILITAERLCLMNQNYEWPAPRAFSQSATSKQAQFDVINQRQINEVSYLNMYADAPLSVIISFFSEDVASTQQSDWSAASWMITMATSNALSLLVEAIRTPWESEFGVELQILRKSVSPQREDIPNFSRRVLGL